MFEILILKTQNNVTNKLPIIILGILKPSISVGIIAVAATTTPMSESISEILFSASLVKLILENFIDLVNLFIVNKLLHYPHKIDVKIF